MKTEEKRYYISNPESGESYEVSKEHYERYEAMKNYFLPKIEGIKGTIIISGTSADENNDFEFRKLWAK